jgi:hypothetical protein
MSHQGSPAHAGNSGNSLDLGKAAMAAGPGKPLTAEIKTQIAEPQRYNDLQSAARFPIKLPVSVKSNCGESRTETQNISANGVLFRMDSEMPVGARVDFTISLPCEVLGTGSDVQIDCRGRVARSFEEDGRRGVGVVIDEYRFERR